jgi:hypothetical protein
MNVKSQLLSEAEGLVTGVRENDYGQSAINHLRIADLWNVWLGNRSFPGPISAYDAAMMMALVKFARCQHRPSHDSHVDIAGYAAVVEDIYQKITEMEKQEETNAGEKEPPLQDG